MKNKFSLLSTLNNSNKPKESMLPKGHKYQEYIITVEGQEKTVFIPLRESETFEQLLSNTKEITITQLREILRKHRGIKG